MCLAAFAIDTSSRWPLVLASNRDEFFDRPALPLSRWQTAAGHTLISGRDERAGGSWLGMTPNGRVALLTNIRIDVRNGMPATAPRSRGELVVRWLEGSDEAPAFTTRTDGRLYGGFNLVLGDLRTGQWHCWSSCTTSPSGAGLQVLKSGIYGLSNAALDTPWPKTVALRSELANALHATSQSALEEIMWKALGNTKRAAQADLPQTGVASDLEWALSSAYIDLPERNYGTRCSSVIVVAAESGQDSQATRNWVVSFKEQTYPNQSQTSQSWSLTNQGLGALPHSSLYL